MKRLIFILSFVSFSSIIVSQVQIKGLNVEIFDYVQQKYIGQDEYIKRYGKRFYEDVCSISKHSKKFTEEERLNFNEAIGLRQVTIEKNRSEWERKREINKEFLRGGKALVTLSSLSAVLAIPILYKTKENSKEKAIINVLKGESYSNELNKVKKRKNGLIITGIVCGIGELVGIGCIIRYRNHRNEYDPPFYFTPALNEESIGFSFMKNF